VDRSAQFKAAFDRILVRACSLTLVLLLLSCCSAWQTFGAEAPTLDYLFPAGLALGTTNSITIGGKYDPWPPQVWTDCSGMRFEPQTNKGIFKVTAEPDAPIGPHLVRIFNGEGSSAPRIFLIGELPEISETETNDGWFQSQSISSLPVTINGRLEKSGDVDSFSVSLEAGKWVVASVDAFALGSPVDPHLALLNEHGVRVAFNSDRAQSFDPFLAWKVEKSGKYILQIAGFVQPPASDIRLAGSPASVYRLTIGQEPVINAVFPLAVRSAGENSLQLSGWNLEENPTNPVSGFTVSATNQGQTLVVPRSRGALRVITDNLPSLLEREPNNSSTNAQDVTWPLTIHGRIDPAGDEDRFQFKAAKEQKLEFRLHSGDLGFPLDATLRIEDTAGKQLTRDDDSGRSFDPLLNWKCPSNGVYVAVISDLYHRGGPDYAYTLNVQEPIADFSVSADTASVRLEIGKTNEVKFAVTRMNAHTNALSAVALDLPQGVIADEAVIKSKDNEGKISLVASAAAKPFNGEFRIRITDKANTNLSHFAQFDLGPKEARFGQMLIPQTERLWLTVVTNSPAPDKEKAKAK